MPVQANVASILAGLTDAQKLQLAQQRIQAILAQKGKIMWEDDCASWIEKNFWVPELKGPLQLAPYQRAALREATRRGSDGKFVYTTIIWSDIKKSIKSTIAAARVLWTLFGVEWANAYIIANDLKGADSRVGFYLRRAIELNPVMKAASHIRNYRVDLPNHSFAESIAIDPAGEAGSNADLVVFSELWGAHENAKQKMWTEMTLPPNKHGYSQRWVETYAGYSGESPLLEQLYQTGVKEGHKIRLANAPSDLEVYANEAKKMFVMWNTRPRLPWQTDEYYAQEEGILTPSEFQRIHRNQWISATGQFVPADWWAACAGETIKPDKHKPVIVGMDAGVSSDCFAIVVVTGNAGIIEVVEVKVWKPKPGKKLDFDGPETYLKNLAKRFNVTEFAYDQYQLHDMATRLRKLGLGWFNQFSQGQDRMIADKHLYDLIRERRLRHPNIDELTEHVMNANAETDKEKMRIVKRAEHLKIDAAVSLSMAAFEAKRLHL